MILGHGIDIVNVDRIEKSFTRFGDKFVTNVLSSSEMEDFSRCKDADKTTFLAKRFAVKEAVSKAIGCGLINGSPLHFRDISLHHYQFGKPYILLTEKLVYLANSMSGIDGANIDFHVSISDDKNMVIASVIMTDGR